MHHNDKKNKTTTQWLTGFGAIWLTGFGAILLAVGLSLLPSATGAAVVREHGVVETTTVLFYLAGVFWLIRRGLQQNLSWNLTAGTLVALLALRELDFHARFTTMGVLKSRYYISPDVPADEKLLVSLLMILILILALRFLWQNAVPLLQGLRSGRRPAVAVALAIGFAVLSKTLDSYSRPIRRLLEPLYGSSTTYLRVYEEVLELAIPVFILLAISYADDARDQSDGRTADDVSRPRTH